MRWLFILTCISAGCDFSVPPLFEATPARGICMCSVCFDEPFCQVNGTEDQYLFGEAACTSAPDVIFADRINPVSARETNEFRRDDFFIRPRAEGRTPVYCLPPPGDAAFAGVTVPTDCPGDPMARDALGYVDPCIDLPFDCRPPTCFDSRFDDPLPDPRDCPPTVLADNGADRLVCAAEDTMGPPGAAGRRTRLKMEDACESGAFESMLRRADDDPRNVPTRLCFLQCGGGLPDGAGPIEAAACDLEAFDPPHVPSTSLRIDIGRSPAALPSTADVEIIRTGRNLTGDVEVEGELALEIRGCAPGVRCEGRLGILQLHGVAPLTLAAIIRSVTIAQPMVYSNFLDPVYITPLSPTRSEIRLNSGVSLFLTGTIDGETVGASQSTDGDLVGVLDWSTGQFSATAMISGVDDRTTLSLYGSLRGVAPVPEAGPNQVAECVAGGATVTLDATESQDLDGDIRSYRWSARRGESYASVATAPVAEVVAPLGYTRYVLRVEDAMGSSDVDGMSVVVEDTAPPTFEALEVDGCLWPPNHRMRLLRLGEEIRAEVRDECDGGLTDIHIVSVESNEADNGRGDGNTTEDIVFGGSALCVRAERAGPGSGRSYTVTFEATDAAGNAVHDTLVIEVSHDRRPTRCALSTAPEVDDGDPRCTPMALPAETSTPPDGADADGDPFEDDDDDAAEARSGNLAGPPRDGPTCAASPSGRQGPAMWALFAFAFGLWRRRKS